MEDNTVNNEIEAEVVKSTVENNDNPIAVIAPESEIISPEDQKLIEQTSNEIIEKFNEAANNLYLKVGEVVISRIFDGNSDEAIAINDPKSKSSKKKIFQELIKELNKLGGQGSAPKKTWLYNAVNLAVAEKKCEEIQGYTGLSASHKIELLQVKEEEEKQEFVKKIKDDELSVRKARELIQGNKDEKSSATKPPSLMSYIKKPVSGFSSENLKYVGGKGGQKALDEVLRVRDSLNAHLEELKAIEQKLQEKQKDK